MTMVTARVHPVHLMNADWAPGGHQPSDQANWLGLSVLPINGCYHPHPPSPFVIITQPESWYSFYRTTEGGRLSWPRHCRKGVQPVPKVVHCSGCRDKHNCPRPLTPQSINHCDLQRHVGVNNLPKVATRQHRGWELNSQPSSCKSNTLITRLPSHPLGYWAKLLCIIHTLIVCSKTNIYLYLRIRVIFNNIFQCSSNWHLVQIAAVRCLQFQTNKWQ